MRQGALPCDAPCPFLLSLPPPLMFNLAPDRHTETLEIAGMTCQSCVAAVRGALADVQNAVVESVEIGTARVDAGPEATREILIEAVEAVGFDVVGGESTPAPR